MMIQLFWKHGCKKKHIRNGFGLASWILSGAKTCMICDYFENTVAHIKKHSQRFRERVRVTAAGEQLSESDWWRNG